MTEIPDIPDNLDSQEERPWDEPGRYFLDGKFQAAILAQDLVDTFKIITLQETKEIFAWTDGYYTGGSNGENALLKWLKLILKGDLAKLSQHNVAELLNQVRLRSYQPYSIFESNLDLLPVANGVLNVRTREFILYSKKEHFFLFQLPVRYDPKADCLNFRQFVSEIVYKSDVPVIQETFGYCLWRDGLASMKKAAMLLGSGDNGKSLLMAVLIALLGKENVESISLADLAENRFSSAYLRGKLANIHPDLPDRSLKETGQFKGLTGDDPMKFEVKHGGQGKFLNQSPIVVWKAFTSSFSPPARRS